MLDGNNPARLARPFERAGVIVNDQIVSNIVKTRYLNAPVIPAKTVPSMIEGGYDAAFARKAESSVELMALFAVNLSFLLDHGPIDCRAIVRLRLTSWILKQSSDHPLGRLQSRMTT